MVAVAAMVATSVSHAVALESDPDEAAARSDADDAEDAAQVEARAAEAAAARVIRELEAADRAVAAATATVSASRGRLGAARVAGQRADGVVRGREVALPPLLLAVRSATDDLRSAEVLVARIHRRTETARAELEVARALLADRALRTFKTGRSSAVTGPVAVLREARDPGQLARGLANLRAVTGDGARTVRSLEAELRRLVAAGEESAAAVDERREDVVDAQAARDLAEAAAETARAQARIREAGVVGAMTAELAARRELTRATERRDAALEAALDTALDDHPDLVTAVRERRPPVPGPGRPEAHTVEDDLDLDARTKQVESRRRALARETRLAGGSRRTAEGWVCPVPGPAFVNDWAFPRSGDRRHQGTDVFADRGAPIVAVAAGEVTVLDPHDGPNDLGGVTVTISDGPHRHYYAHLERISPQLRRGDVVRAGEVIGWVGTSGNARGTPPHLHLGWFVDDVAVNPYASLAVACRDQGWRTPSPASTAR